MGNISAHVGGRVLSTLFWVLTLSLIIKRLHGEGYITVAFADDVAILIIGEFMVVIGMLLQATLDRI